MKMLIAVMSMLCMFATIDAQVISYQEIPTPESKAGINVFLEYTSPRDEVIISNGKLTHISKTYQYDENRPYVATPVSMSTSVIANNIPLNGRQLTSLKEAIRNSGLTKLQRQNYGAPHGQRSYDYTLRIEVDGRAYSYIYRSNPSYPNAPQQFNQMKEYIWKLVAEAER
jgi:hypothetical protein